MVAEAEITFESRKQELRAEVLPRRRIAHFAWRERAPEKIIRLLEENIEKLGVDRRKFISAYWPIRTEVDVKPVLHWLHEQGYKVCLPVVVNKDEALVFRQWKPDSKMQEGRFGTQEPVSSTRNVEPQVMLVPLVAFDRRGTRLGYGGGYYDRTIFKLQKKREATAVGIAYGSQEVRKIPRGQLDAPLDWILTESGLIKADPDFGKDS